MAGRKKMPGSTIQVSAVAALPAHSIVNVRLPFSCLALAKKNSGADPASVRTPARLLHDFGKKTRTHAKTLCICG
jgi:hypothetical protein